MDTNNNAATPGPNGPKPAASTGDRPVGQEAGTNARSAPTAKLRDQRLDANTRYLSARLNYGSPDQAIVAGLAVDLVAIHRRMFEALEAVSVECTDPEELLACGSAARDQLLKVDRQIERLMRLDHDVEHSQGPSAS